MMHVSVMMLSYSTLMVGALLAIAFLIVTRGKKSNSPVVPSAPTATATATTASNALKTPNLKVQKPAPTAH